MSPPLISASLRGRQGWLFLNSLSTLPWLCLRRTFFIPSAKASQLLARPRRPEREGALEPRRALKVIETFRAMVVPLLGESILHDYPVF